MIWYTLATVFPSFTLGFAACNYLYTKRIKELTEHHTVHSSNLLKTSFRAGWDAANNNANNVKLQYDKLVNPLKYAPKKD